MVLIDANDELKSGTDWHNFAMEHALVDCFQHRHPSISVRTYNRGKRQIDSILVSSSLLSALKTATIEEFGSTPFPHSDHRSLTAVFDRASLMGSATLSPSIQAPRHLHSKHPNIVCRYLKILQEECNKAQILQRGAALDNLTKSQWNDSHWDEFNQLDKEFTAICIKAERRCGFPTDKPWSPQVHVAFCLRQYWKLKRTQLATGISMQAKLTNLQLEIENAMATLPDKCVKPPPRCASFLFVGSALQPSFVVKRWR